MRTAAIALAICCGACDYFAYTLPGARVGCGGRFECTEDTAADGLTGLTWIRKRTQAESFEEAEAHCRSTRTLSKFDWRLPTLEELEGIDDRSFADYFLDREVFPIDGSLPFFSSTEKAGKIAGWSYFDLAPGGEVIGTPGGPCTAAPSPAGEVALERGCMAFVRCVRGAGE